MPFLDHLEELRRRLLKSLISILVGAIITFYFIDTIIEFLIKPSRNLSTPMELQVLKVQGMFMIKWGIALIGGFVTSIPVLTYQLWKFIAPGLYKHEKVAILPYLVLTPILFFLGGMLVYYLIMPLAIKFFLSFESTGMSTSLPIQLEAKVNEYLSLVMKLIFAFGISFQLPIVLSLLARIGVVDSQFLKERRKYVVIIIFAAACLLYTSDAADE